MTRYLSSAEMLSYFPGPQLAQALGGTRNTDGTYAIDATKLEVFIAMAEDEADAYISTHYKLPLLQVPAILKQMVADVARYAVYSQRSEPIVQQRYDRAISFFKQIASGKLLLGVPNQDSRVATLNNLPSFTKRVSRFADSSLSYDSTDDQMFGNKNGW